MDLDEAIRTRRTHKVFGDEPVDRATLRELIELAAYWRTPGLLREAAGRRALGIGDDEAFVGLVHIGPLRQDSVAPARAPLDQVLIELD